MVYKSPFQAFSYILVGTQGKTVKEVISHCNSRRKRWDTKQVVPFAHSQCWKSGIFSLFVEINSASIDWGTRCIRDPLVSPTILLSGTVEICTCYATLSRDIPWIIIPLVACIYLAFFSTIPCHRKCTGQHNQPRESMRDTPAHHGKVGCCTVKYTKDFLIGCISMEWYKYVFLTMYTTYFPCSGVR